MQYKVAVYFTQYQLIPYKRGKCTVNYEKIIPLCT